MDEANNESFKCKSAVLTLLSSLCSLRNWMIQLATTDPQGDKKAPRFLHPTAWLETEEAELVSSQADTGKIQGIYNKLYEKTTFGFYMESFCDTCQIKEFFVLYVK